MSIPRYSLTVDRYAQDVASGPFSANSASINVWHFSGCIRIQLGALREEIVVEREHGAATDAREGLGLNRDCVQYEVFIYSVRLATVMQLEALHPSVRDVEGLASLGPEDYDLVHALD